MPWYGEKFRGSVIKEKESREERPLHRPKGYEEEDRRRKKRRNKTAWYKPGDTVLFVPPTPNGQVKRNLQGIADQNRQGKIKR